MSQSQLTVPVIGMTCANTLIKAGKLLEALAILPDLPVYLRELHPIAAIVYRFRLKFYCQAGSTGVPHPLAYGRQRQAKVGGSVVHQAHHTPPFPTPGLRAMQPGKSTVFDTLPSRPRLLWHSVQSA
jgi:hypothetical protein